MPIDTEGKRRSVSGYTLGVGLVLPVADGAIGAGDRAHVAGLYSGTIRGTLYQQSISGAIAAANLTGALTRQVRRALAGTIADSSLVGDIRKETRRFLTGALTPAGALSAAKVALKSLAGSIASLTATLQARANKLLAGEISPAASLVRRTNKSLSAGLTPSGATTASKLAFLALTGAIAAGQLAGAVVKRTQRLLDGALSSSGTVSRQPRVAMTGTVTPAAELRKRIPVRIAGAIAPAGAMAFTWLKILVGSLAPIGIFSTLFASRAVVHITMTVRAVVTPVMRLLSAVRATLVVKSAATVRVRVNAAEVGPVYEATPGAVPRTYQVNALVEQKRAFDAPHVGYVHGSTFVDPYYIGTSIQGGGVTRSHKDNLSVYDRASAGIALMEEVVYVPSRGKAYTIGWQSSKWWLIEITPDPFSTALVMELTGTINSFPFGCPMATDGTALYFVTGGASGVLGKIDLNTLTVVASVDTSAVVPQAHAMLYSSHDGKLYLTSAASAGNNAKMAKYDPANLAAGALASVQIPGSADDIGESAGFIFGAIELTDSALFGYSYGAYAVRRSDFALFSLPRLDAADAAGIVGYAASVFDGRWLILLKTNRKLYAIDLVRHPPHTWSQASDVSQVVDLIATFQLADLAGWTDQVGLPLVPNEIAYIGQDRFLSFGWPVSPGSGTRAGVIRFRVPGLADL